jgi:uncharacterized protein with ParB-like and HNH nuclease domain
MDATKKTMTITQEPVTLGTVLGNNIFEVPLYQREFSWELEQVSDLFYDIESSNESEGHFLGSLLLYIKDSEKNIKEIIDGQQRLTTLFLILYSIKKAIEDSEYTKAKEAINNLLYQRSKSLLVSDVGEEPRMTTGKRDKRLFRAILRGEQLDAHKDGRRKSHKLLLNIFQIFLKDKIEKIKKDTGIEGVISFADKIFNSRFIVMTAEKKTDKILLFKTLNARGLELSQSDLIKNEVCNTRKHISEEDAIALWDEMRETLERYKADIDLFLFHYINSIDDASEIRKRIEERRSIKGEKEAYPPVPEKYIFDVYEEKLKSITNTEEFLNDLKKAAENYEEIYTPTPDKFYLHSLKILGTNKCYPLLIRGKKVLNARNFERLTQVIDCISFRHSIMKIDPKDLEKFYYTALNKLKSDTDIQKVIEEAKLHSTMSQNLDRKFKDDFCVAYPKNAISKMILSRISRHLHEGLDLKGKDISLEHIMPKNPKGKEWEELKNSDKELYEFSVDRIGNLTLLQDKLNVSAGNKSFLTKKENYYSNSGVGLTRELTEYAHWNFDTIDDRQLKLYEYAKDIWRL